jgi:predicted Rossmann fold flavoprotein
MEMFDVVIVGAGAAGLFCAGVAGQLGQKVLLVDHSDKVAEKIRISGGGRCNFTNTGTTAAHFLSDNPRFCRSALARYTPQDFVALVKSYGIAFHEKHKGQLFCDRSAEDLIAMLLAECDKGGVTRWQGCAGAAVRYSDGAQDGMRYQIDTARGTVQARALVIATGGLSIPKIGATDFGYRIAKQREAAMNTHLATRALERDQDQAEADARSLWAAHTAAKEAQSLAMQERALAEKALKLAEASYELGALTFLDLWQTRQQRDGAELAELAADMQLDLAAVNLIARTGGW